MKKTPIHLVWCGHAFSPSGFGTELRDFLMALHQNCKTVRQRLIPFDKKPAWFHLERRMHAMMRTLIARRHRGDELFIYHLFMRNIAALAKDKMRFSYPALGRIVRTTFEPDRLLPHWVEYLNGFDEVWVPSDFNIATFSSSGVRRKKLVKIPETFDDRAYDPGNAVPLKEIRALNKFIFLTILPLDQKHFRSRKGLEILLQAYVNEFKEDDGASLLLHVAHHRGEKSWDPLSCVREIAKGANLDIAQRKDIIVRQDYMSCAQMPRLYRSADAFVLPSRGEGWGRLYTEAMAMGLPTIGTRWSGNIEFMNERNSYLIDCKLVKIDLDSDSISGYWRHPSITMRWAEPSVAHLRSIMRFVFTNREKAKKIGLQAQRDITRRYNRRAVAGIIENNLRRFIKSHR